jgi:hypothetical protein
MSLRSLATAFAEGATEGKARPLPSAGEVASELAYRAVEGMSDAHWNAQGGPWCAQYHRFASLTAIGIGEGEPHREHFMDPFDALEYFRQLPDRYRNDATLRRSCLIVYKDNWYCVEPFADDADHAVDVMREEVRRDMGLQRGQLPGKKQIARGIGAGVAGANNKGGAA